MVARGQLPTCEYKPGAQLTGSRADGLPCPQLVTRLQQICTNLGETAMSENAVLWNKLSTIVVVGGQVRDRAFFRA